MIRLYHQVDISKFTDLVDFVRVANKGYKPKKSPVFTDGDIAEFLDVADDQEWLCHKVRYIIILNYDGPPWYSLHCIDSIIFFLY